MLHHSYSVNTMCCKTSFLKGTNKIAAFPEGYGPKQEPMTKDNRGYSLTWPVYMLIYTNKRKLACENIRFSSLFVAGDVSRGGTSATQWQKFHTDDAKSVRNPVRSADWSTE